ncbi:uncharacterized protein MEPE_02528 [Melanopsichium pennsylvanicum]|uniref:DH domain-containing protein n=2 Tax=Melanopsichium pennsylvanicum TaxID=63383 RepID=A0AAJ5C4M1_9BASI|nr:uncharacterized protein BN887_02227 [Melanopsichium pennsylvanicum 4]SNX83820.1 uncharacterized protein MEPE_02528 [Melanopsichium pennsylvanicum]
MTPPHVQSGLAPTLDSFPPPPLPEKQHLRPLGTAQSTRTLSNSSIPTLTTARLARQPPAPSSASPPSRRPVRPGIFPPSSRSALPIPALDPSQDHHRSDSGRSTGSSRSTATTDSFFLPQHPPNRRLKDLPTTPSLSTLSDVARQPKLSEGTASALGLNVSVGMPAPLPQTSLSRSKSSVSTTPTSPGEGDGSPLGHAGPGDYPPLDDDDPRRSHKLAFERNDGLDDFWKSDYSYGRPSADLLEPSLPPLMRSNAPIPPSRSQSLDPFAAPLDAQDGITEAVPQESIISHEDARRTSSATPLVAANLHKLNSQHLAVETSPAATSKASATSLSPVLSPASTLQTTTSPSGPSRLAVPQVSPYKQPAASAHSSSSALDQKSQPNKSTSSLSTNSAHEADKISLATASKRSSGSSSSSFRMTLSRQAKSLRNSLMWNPPTTAQQGSTSQERITASPALLSPESFSTPLSQGSSPGLALSSPGFTYDELPPKRSSPHSRGMGAMATDQAKSRTELACQQQINLSAAASPYTKPPSLHSSRSSADARSVHSGSTASRPSVTQSPKQPTDYSKLEERPKSRLSSRLTMHNTSWSAKLSNFKAKKTGNITPRSDAHTLEARPRASGRRSKSNVSSSATSIALPSNFASKTSSARRTVKKPTSLLIPSSPLETSTDAQISPSFAETFAFLNSHIDSLDGSPPLLATALPALIEAKTTSANEERIPTTSSMTPRQPNPESAQKMALAPASTATGSGQPVPPKDEVEDKAPKETLFDRLADSPEAVYKTLVLPAPDPESQALSLPASKSLDTLAPSSSHFGTKFGHKKQASLGSATLISKSARKAAADLDKRASNAPVALSGPPLAHSRISTRPSLSSVLPAFTPVDEESHFFDALTSPLSERPSTANASPSADGSVLPSFTTASDFFTQVHAEPSSPLLDRAFVPKGVPSVAPAEPSAPQHSRSSLGRRLSGVFDPSRARSMRRNLLASPLGNPHAELQPAEHLPARPETSMGFHLRNPLRRERKASLTKAPAVPQSMPGPDRSESALSSRKMSPASAIRKMSEGFKLDRPVSDASGPARAGTSLGFSTTRTKTPRSLSSNFMAPTRSSLARSVQQTPPSVGKAGSRSTTASSLGTSSINHQSRSPQRSTNPPSSFRGATGSSSRPSAVSNGSPFKDEASRSSLHPAMSRTNDLERSAPDGPPSPLAFDEPVQRQNAFQSSAAPLLLSRPNQDADSVTSADSDLRRRRTLSKPVLRPIRTSFAEDAAFARPSTAMGLRGSLTAQDRKMSQPTLDMIDDREFLKALEQVRAVHRERIHVQAQEAQNKTRLARLGMMSDNHLKTKISESMLGDCNGDGGADKTSRGVHGSGVWSDATKAVADAGSKLRHKRSASAGAKLGRSRSTSSTSRDTDREVDQRQKDIIRAYADKKPPIGLPTTGLEWGVGKASGKLHDGTFVNDDDWEKEVKALFLIRELVQTERSYARHLGSLLSVIRKMSVAPTSSTNALGVKRKSTSNLFAAYTSAYSGKSSSSGPSPSHIMLLRTHLPQLIALSNALVQRVEDNPTSAGVGAAFDVLSAQLESTFVAWSSVTSQALGGLRSTETAKGKSPFKIGLVPLMPRESTEVGALTTGTSSSSGASSPGSGFKHNSTLRITSLTRPASPVKNHRDIEAFSTSDAAGGATLPAKRSPKRRSTISSTSFIPPRLNHTSAAPIITASPEEDESVLAETSVASRRYAHSRSQSTFVTPLPTPTSAVHSDSWSPFTMTSSTTNTTNIAAPATTKCLSPMDIAIMPTQRISRYGLMLRDLLRNTPPESLSHARVQRAIALIQKIALLCDSAAPVTTAPASGATTPSRANSVLGMTTMGGGDLTIVHPNPLLASSFTKRN